MKIGFIGSGNMGRMMIDGIVASGMVDAANIYVADGNASHLEEPKALGCTTFDNNKDLAKVVDILFLTVKPQAYAKVSKEIKDLISKETVIVTVAPGKSIADMRAGLHSDTKVVRTMPNVPVQVREGCIAYCHSENVSEEELNEVEKIFSSIGKLERVTEGLMDTASAICGSLPAYIVPFIDGIADGAVANGMTYEQAYRMACQAILGTSKVLLETDITTGELKERVCSPGGTSIEAVRVLEEDGIRATMIRAVNACIEKAKIL